MHLDPAAVAAYNATMQRVAADLVNAAKRAAGAPITAQLAADLGPVGARFASEFGILIESHAAALAAGAHLVGEYGKVMASFTGVAVEVDSHNADVITQVGDRL
ncbi:hypothetical protein [Nocardia sp. XZ_19_369]|uniref:hypothetical protein n=1 Tax=Nocardia sp. XZ_19_369 TaxID=2769487 RepID=UPI0018902E60|nr:hypothetical protein [Nocardia sp. XZ_19_369]